MKYVFRTLWNKLTALSGLGMRAGKETNSVEKRGRFGLQQIKEGAEGGKPALPGKHQPALVMGSGDVNYFSRVSRKAIT